MSSRAFARHFGATRPFTDPPSLVIETEVGAISVERRGGDAIEIVVKAESDAEERVDGARLVIDDQPDGTLRVGVDWPGGWSSRWNDAANITVRLPEAASIDLESKLGAIAVADMAGVLRARTTNGAISVTNHDGAVRLRSSNGAVVALDLTGPVVAESRNGAMQLTLDGSPGPVDLQTTNGAIDLTVDHAFRGTLTMTTSNGGVDVDGIDDAPAELLQLTPRSATVRFNAADTPNSTARTSNGGVKLRVND
jgi:hypothetical protein